MNGERPVARQAGACFKDVFAPILFFCQFNSVSLVLFQLNISKYTVYVMLRSETEFTFRQNQCHTIYRKHEKMNLGISAVTSTDRLVLSQPITA